MTTVGNLPHPTTKVGLGKIYNKDGIGQNLDTDKGGIGQNLDTTKVGLGKIWIQQRWDWAKFGYNKGGIGQSLDVQG